MSPSVHTECPKCSARFRLKSASAFGKTITCRKCGRPFRARPADDDDFGQDDSDDDLGLANDEIDRTRRSPALPSRSRSKRKKGRPKSKRKAWKVPVAIFAGIAVLFTVVWVGFQFVPGASIGSLTTVFDSHEKLIRDRMDIYRKVENLLASLETMEDIEASKPAMVSIVEQVSRLNQRMVALGAIEQSRVDELTKLWKAREPEIETAKRRIDVHIDRLKEVVDLSFAVHKEVLRDLPPDFHLVSKLVEPKTVDSRTAELRQFEYDCVVQLRKANLILIQMTNSESAGNYVDELKTVSDEISRLADRRSTIRASGPSVTIRSPYYKQYSATLSFMRRRQVSIERLEQWSAENPAGTEAIRELHLSVSDLEFSRFDPMQSHAANGNGVSGTGPNKRLTIEDWKERHEASKQRFINLAGGPAKVVTMNFVNGDLKKATRFADEISSRKLTKLRRLRPNRPIIWWGESPQSLADKIDFAEILSVNNEQRTLEVKLPD